MGEAALQEGELLGGRFRLGPELKSGAYGHVLLAHDERLDTQVAIKVLKGVHASSETERRRFEEEARAIGRIVSEHVVTVHDMGWCDGAPFIVMPRLYGKTLEERIQESRGLVPAEAEYILRGVLRGAAAAHDAGIIHRDIKPSNVFLRADPHHPRGWGWPVLLDFGVARACGRETLTAAGTPVGTPQYMAPEQRRGEPSTEASDVYSVGLLAYEMLIGARPPTAYDEKPAPLHESKRLLGSGLTSRLGGAIDKALEPRPEERFQSAVAFLDALDAPEDARQLVPGMVVGEVYELEQKLGEGGMSVVWSARDRELDQPVALKVAAVTSVERSMRSTLTKRFEREARVLASLSHRNLVRVLGAGTWQGLPFVVLEKVEGQTLADSWTQMSWAKLLDCLRQVAGALDTVHARGVLHRDVKPENILIRAGQGDAVLIDFGIARVGELALTVAGETPFTSGRASPEVLRGEPAIPKSDQWSLASVVYGFLTGSLPGGRAAEGASPTELEQLDSASSDHQVRPVRELVPTIPVDLDDVVMKALSPNPTARFENCAAFVEALAKATPPAHGAWPANLDNLIRREEGKPPWHWLGLAGALVIALGIGYAGWTRNAAKVDAELVVPSDVGIPDRLAPHAAASPAENTAPAAVAPAIENATQPVTIRVLEGTRLLHGVALEINNRPVVGSLELEREPGVMVVRVVDQRFVDRPGETFVVEDDPLVAEIHVSRKGSARKGNAAPAPRSSEAKPAEGGAQPTKRRWDPLESTCRHASLSIL